MKLQSVILSVFLACNGQMLYADALSKTSDETVKPVQGAFFQKTTPEMMYGYTNFDFDSVSQGGNFNKYNGYSNLYSAGADHLSWGPSIMAGIYYFRIETQLTAEFLLAPGPLANSAQTISNNTIFAHVLKIFTSNIYADLAGGYGYNRFNTVTELFADPTAPTVAGARNNNNNWFLSLNGIYRKTWNKYLLRANLGMLYSQINTDGYNYVFSQTNQPLAIAALTNKATLVLENAELGYFVSPKFMPFINGGLIQVVQFSNSRPVIDPLSTINGSLPQINMDKNGFRLGAGASVTHKNVTLRIEEKYYNAGGTFQSYQTLAALEYQFT